MRYQYSTSNGLKSSEENPALSLVVTVRPRQKIVRYIKSYPVTAASTPENKVSAKHKTKKTRLFYPITPSHYDSICLTIL
jgi:hypothetical protein